MEPCATSTPFTSDDAEKSIKYLSKYFEIILCNWAKVDIQWNGKMRQYILHELQDRLEALQALS
jgi:hypothetical protein